ncbi:hypothetical protein CAL7716_080400 [Calothrix sp. PCC 7716]|nr:hypothetical protein CAL7716_080400 [Calothrix sp. PCC 7716]
MALLFYSHDLIFNGVSHPESILADELTTTSDSKLCRVLKLMQLLAKEKGCTVLMVTHDNHILDIADLIIYMKDGISYGFLVLGW